MLTQCVHVYDSKKSASIDGDVDTSIPWPMIGNNHHYDTGSDGDSRSSLLDLGVDGSTERLSYDDNNMSKKI